MKSLHRIAFIVNKYKQNALSFYKEIDSYAKSIGMETSFFADYPLKDDCLKDCDICCTIGGDGTLLGVLPYTIKGIPILGLNCGKLGFLATFSLEAAKSSLDSIILGDYKISSRTVLHCNGNFALNDIVIKQKTSARLMTIRLFYDDQFVNEMSCDGLIISTPTGSTAYNLSANGPIVHFSAEAFIVTPICPHKLNNRSIVLDNKGKLHLETDNFNDVTEVAFDGRTIDFSTKKRNSSEKSDWHENENIFSLSIKTSHQKCHFIEPKNFNYFDLLRTKLNW